MRDTHSLDRNHKHTRRHHHQPHCEIEAEEVVVHTQDGHSTEDTHPVVASHRAAVGHHSTEVGTGIREVEVVLD